MNRDIQEHENSRPLMQPQYQCKSVDDTMSIYQRLSHVVHTNKHTYVYIHVHNTIYYEDQVQLEVSGLVMFVVPCL